MVFTNYLSPQCGAYSRDFLDKKSKSPLFPRVEGLWLLVHKSRAKKMANVCLQFQHGKNRYVRPGFFIFRFMGISWKSCCPKGGIKIKE